MSLLKKQRNWGMLLLAAWLILTGLLTFVNIGFRGLPELMAVLAIAAGVLIILER